jgi:predicted nucleotidyltransferase
MYNTSEEGAGVILTTTQRDQVLAQIKSLLAQAFGERLRGVILYGSEARGQAGADSDIDLLVLLEGPLRDSQDSWDCIHALYPLVLEIERPIHAYPVSVEDYEKQEYPLYRNVKREGVVL